MGGVGSKVTEDTTVQQSAMANVYYCALYNHYLFFYDYSSLSVRTGGGSAYNNTATALLNNGLSLFRLQHLGAESGGVVIPTM